MDYAGNFKVKNIVLRAFAFVLYFFVSGFAGRLCVVLTKPVFSLVLKPFPDAVNIIFYIISVTVMFIAISFFSMREGSNDTELLRFSYGKNFLAYTISGIIFYLLILYTLTARNYYIYYEHEKFFTALNEYFFLPFFLPEEIIYIMRGFVFFPSVPVLYNITENIKYFILMQWVNTGLSVILCVILGAGFYKRGRKKWIDGKKQQIEQTKRFGR